MMLMGKDETGKVNKPIIINAFDTLYLLCDCMQYKLKKSEA